MEEIKKDAGFVFGGRGRHINEDVNMEREILLPA
jgi:hypothetical protein